MPAGEAALLTPDNTARSKFFSIAEQYPAKFPFKSPRLEIQGQYKLIVMKRRQYTNRNALMNLLSLLQTKREVSSLEMTRPAQLKKINNVCTLPCIITVDRFFF